MMTEFESIDANEALKRTKVKKFRELNTKWKKTLALMKMRKEEQHEESIHRRVESMALKKSLMDKILKENEEKKQQIVSEMKHKNKESFDLIHDKNQRRAEQIEKERLLNEKKTHERLNRISGHREINMRTFRDNFRSHTEKSLEHFKENWKHLGEENEQRAAELKSKEFEKYAGWVNLIV